MITTAQISSYRQTIRQLNEKIDRLSSRCLFTDELIHGTPAEVFRKCGRKNCKCAEDEKQRHGPYKVIQVIRKGKSRQVCLRREQEHLWGLAVHYRHQVEKLSELKQFCEKLQDVVAEVIEKRKREFPKRVGHEIWEWGIFSAESLLGSKERSYRSLEKG